MVSALLMEEMINDIAPQGRATLPEKLKVDVFNRLRRDRLGRGTSATSSY